MKTRKIECDKINDIESLYNELERVLELPDCFGRNLDALWDCVTGEIELPIKVIWNRFEKIKNNLDSDFINKLMTLFEEAKEELEGLLEVEYK